MTGNTNLNVLEQKPLMGLLSVCWVRDEICIISRMAIKRRKLKQSEKNKFPVPFCPPQIQHELPWD
jgi:hypothetical protein